MPLSLRQTDWLPSPFGPAAPIRRIVMRPHRLDQSPQTRSRTTVSHGGPTKDHAAEQSNRLAAWPEKNVPVVSNPTSKPHSSPRLGSMPTNPIEPTQRTADQWPATHSERPYVRPRFSFHWPTAIPLARPESAPAISADAPEDRTHVFALKSSEPSQHRPAVDGICSVPVEFATTNRNRVRWLAAMIPTAARPPTTHWLD